MLRFLMAMVRWGWSAAGLQRQTSYMDTKIERLRGVVADTELRLLSDKAALDESYADITAKYNRASASIDDGLRANRKLTEALDAAHEQLRTCQEILIPGLVTANEVFVKRWEADIAASSMKTAFGTAGGQGHTE